MAPASAAAFAAAAGGRPAPGPVGHHRPQKHLRWTMEGPDSSYSLLAIHICWNVVREARMEPPIHTEYCRSDGVVIVSCFAFDTTVLSSFFERASISGYIVVQLEIDVDDARARYLVLPPS